MSSREDKEQTHRAKKQRELLYEQFHGRDTGPNAAFTMLVIYRGGWPVNRSVCTHNTF